MTTLQATFDPVTQSEPLLSDTSAIAITNQLTLIPSNVAASITPPQCGYASAVDLNYYFGIDYQTNYLAVDLPYTCPVNNSIVGASIPLQTPFGSHGWIGNDDATVKLTVTADSKGLPDFTHVFNVQSVSMKPILGSNGVHLVGTGKTVDIQFSFATPIAVAAGQKIHFVLSPGDNWPTITQTASGYALVCPSYDPNANTNTFGTISSLNATTNNLAILAGTAPNLSSQWSKSAHVASFSVLLQNAIYSTTSPGLTYIFNANKLVTWDFSTFSAVENSNGEQGNVTYSVLVSNASGYYFNTSSVFYINRVTQAKLKSLPPVIGSTFILQVHLNSPDGIKSASAGVAKISYH